MNHLLIDGYNLLAARQGSLNSNRADLQQLREELLQALLQYRQARPAKITVVFDAQRGPHIARTKENYRGIELIFSPRGELADQTIKKMFKGRGSKWLVITSDREVADFVQNLGGVSIPAQEFSERLDFALYAAQKGLVEEEPAAKKTQGTKKSGPNKRQKKSQRRRKQRLKKL